MKRIKNYIKEIYKAIIKPEMMILPGNLAYFVVLALIPTLTLIVYIASLFSISIDLVINLINKFIPETSANIIIDVISGKGFDESVGLFIIIALFIACNGTYAIIKASNLLYKIDKTEELKDRIKSFIILLLVLIIFIFLLLVPIFGNQILELIKNIKGTENIIDDIIILFNIIKWPITFLIVYFNIKLIYTMAPSKRIESYTTTYGALTTTICWSFITAIFTYYLKHFARYDILYGNLSSIIILMIWMYVLCYIFVLGMAINVSRYNKIEKNDNNK